MLAAQQWSNRWDMEPVETMSLRTRSMPLAVSSQTASLPLNMLQEARLTSQSLSLPITRGTSSSSCVTRQKNHRNASTQTLLRGLMARPNGIFLPDRVVEMIYTQWNMFCPKISLAISVSFSGTTRPATLPVTSLNSSSTVLISGSPMKSPQPRHATTSHRLSAKKEVRRTFLHQTQVDRLSHPFQTRIVTRSGKRATIKSPRWPQLLISLRLSFRKHTTRFTILNISRKGAAMAPKFA